MESEKDDAPKNDKDNAGANHPQPVIYSSTTIVLGVFGYVLILILAKLANDNRNLVFKEASFGQSHDHIIELDTVDRATNWEFIGTSGAAKVDTYVRKVEGSKLFAFKGVVVIDEHISDVMRTFGSVSTTPEWADMLKIMETMPVAPNTEDTTDTGTEKQRKGLFSSMVNKFKSITKKKGAAAFDVVADGDNILLNRPFSKTTAAATLSDLVYQYYILPWPISPREFLFRRDFTMYPSTRSITSRYVSTTDDRQPLPLSHRASSPSKSDATASTSTGNTTPSGTAISKHTIRAESPFTNWLFQDLDTYCLLHIPSTTTAAHSAARATQVCAEVMRTLMTDASAPSKPTKRRTYIEIESLVDNKGSLPAWLVNYVQRSWAPKTLSAMAASVYKQAAAPRENVNSEKSEIGGVSRDEGQSNTRHRSVSSGVVKYIVEW